MPTASRISTTWRRTSATPIKRQLKAQGAGGLQGEFGIGLLSFWTLGEELLADLGQRGRTRLSDAPLARATRAIASRTGPTLFAEAGTEVLIRGILPGIKNFSGDKIQWYLASELRDRIRHSGVSIRVVDRTARAEYKVEPRQFEGRLLHELDGALPPQSEVYAELYLHAHSPANAVSLYRSGTRVLGNLTELEAFARMPWTSGYVQGIIDAPYLNLTPGTRLGVIHDAALARLADELAPLESRLAKIIEDQQRAEEERASRDVLRSVQGRAQGGAAGLAGGGVRLVRSASRRGQASAANGRRKRSRRKRRAQTIKPSRSEAADNQEAAEAQRQFFEFAGPLFSVMISPTSSVIEVGGSRALRAVARDRARRPVEHDLAYAWAMLEGEGTLDHAGGEMATFRAAAEPGLARVEVTVTQGDVVCKAEAQITVAASLLPKAGGGDSTYQGLPGYTFHKAAGELWRSRFDAERNLVVINNGHRDFVYAARSKMLKLRYICRLFAKELVLKNFIGIPPDQLLERLLELTLYTEENLR